MNHWDGIIFWHHSSHQVHNGTKIRRDLVTRWGRTYHTSYVRGQGFPNNIEILCLATFLGNFDSVHTSLRHGKILDYFLDNKLIQTRIKKCMFMLFFIFYFQKRFHRNA